MSERFVKIAAVYPVVGACLGLYMGLSQNFVLMPDHAHVLLAGWLTLAMAGVLYRTFPACAGTRLAQVHFWLHNLGLPVFMVGLAHMLNGRASMTPVVGAGAVTFLIGLFCFAINLWRRI
jgi:hypothetical protein